MSILVIDSIKDKAAVALIIADIVRLVPVNEYFLLGFIFQYQSKPAMSLVGAEGRDAEIIIVIIDFRIPGPTDRNDSFGAGNNGYQKEQG
jgi:hypothetical protein